MAKGIWPAVTLYKISVIVKIITDIWMLAFIRKKTKYEKNNHFSIYRPP